MENNLNDLAQRGVVNELVQGRDLAKQLQLILLNDTVSSSSMNNDTQEMVIVEKIVASFERSLAILQRDPVIGGVDSSSYSFSGSPKSQDSHEGDLKDNINQPKDESRKRRLLPCWTQKVQICSGNELEGPVDDGYNWRKYGQKDILGAQYPRGYYRCTLRQAQGCLARKQVQRSDDDPTIFEVTYRGKHTCTQSSSSSSSTPLNPTENPNPSKTLGYQLHPQKSQEIILNFRTNPKDIKPFNPNTNKHLKSSSSLTFPSSSMAAIDHQTPTSMLYNNNMDDDDDHGNFSTNSRLMTNSFNDYRHDTNSPVTHPDFSFDQGEFDHDLIMFDDPQFFP